MADKLASGTSREGRTDPLIEHYRAQFRHFGATHHALLWTSEQAQLRRFRVLCDVIAPTDSVVDVGCGLGDLLAYLRRERSFTGEYLGLDFVPEFIAHCRARFDADAGARFEIFDARAEAVPIGFDCYVVCGTFNNLVTTVEDNMLWRRRTIEQLYRAARKVAAFNALSTYGNPEAPGLVLTHPHEMLEWCAERVTPNLALRHDYNPPPEQRILADYTIYLFK
jgi:SAM-dependent methyltransferase